MDHYLRIEDVQPGGFPDELLARHCRSPFGFVYANGVRDYYRLYVPADSVLVERETFDDVKHPNATHAQRLREESRRLRWSPFDQSAAGRQTRLAIPCRLLDMGEDTATVELPSETLDEGVRVVTVRHWDVIRIDSKDQEVKHDSE